MAGKKPLEPEDFPVQVRKNKVVTDDGEPVAEGRDEKTAEEIAERLNENEAQRDQDRWSA